MKVLVAAALLVSTGAHASPSGYPSCDLKAQHVLRGPTGGPIADSRQAHVSARADILQADLGTARKARHLDQAAADRLYGRVEEIRDGADRFTAKQGFLSAGEVASYDRGLDAVAMQICGRATGVRYAAGTVSDGEYLQDRAVKLDSRIGSAARKRVLTRDDVAALRLAVRQVQTEAGHLQAVNGGIDRPDADRMNQKLTDVERRLTSQP